MIMRGYSTVGLTVFRGIGVACHDSRMTVHGLCVEGEGCVQRALKYNKRFVSN